MKKLLGIVALGLMLIINPAHSKYGKGEINLSKETMEIFLDYIYGGAKNLNASTGGSTSNKEHKSQPLLFTLHEDGIRANWNYCSSFQGCKPANKYRSIQKCQKNGGTCYTFAVKKRIVWKNSKNPRGLNLTKELKYGRDHVAQIIKDGGYYNNDITLLRGYQIISIEKDGSKKLSSITTTPKITKKIDSKKYTDGLTYFSKCSWSPDENDYHDSFEVDMKKKTIVHEFFATGETYKNKEKIILNNDIFIKTKIEEYGDNYVQYIFNKKNDEVTTIIYKDKKGKDQEDEYLLFCKDIFGTLNNQKIEKKKENESDGDIVKKLTDLKDLLDSGVLSKEEFEKAKKKLLN